MCNPAIIPIAAAAIPAAISIGSELLGASEQNKAAADNEKRATKAAQENLGLLSLRQMQERQLQAQTIYRMDQEARRAAAETQVAAGESGVAGVSVEMVLSDLERQRLEARTQVNRNTQASVDQIEQDKQAVKAGRLSQLAAVPYANPWAVGIRTAGHAANGVSNYLSSAPPSGGNNGKT